MTDLAALLNYTEDEWHSAIVEWLGPQRMSIEKPRAEREYARGALMAAAIIRAANVRVAAPPSDDAAPLRPGVCECGPVCAACGRLRVAGDAELREALENAARWRHLNDREQEEHSRASFSGCGHYACCDARAALATPTDTEAGG